MNALTPYERMDDLLSSAWPDFFRRSRWRDPPAVRMPSEMKLDVSETDKAYVVKAQIPGAKIDEKEAQANSTRVC